MTTTGAIEPVTTILALRVGETLLLLAFWALAIHLAIGDVVFEDQTAFCTDLGIAAMIGLLATRRRTDKNRMTRVTPVLAASHFFTNRTFFHQSTSTYFISEFNQG